MRDRLRTALANSHEREKSTTTRVSHVQAFTSRFPLVHRSVTPGGPTLETILTDRRLRAMPPCTRCEIDCGIPRALYFFLGCAAYPEGAVAFLAPNDLLDSEPASYSPFDTGSLDKYARPRDPLQLWSAPEKFVFLKAHLGQGADAVAFSAEYIAAHFEHAADYVRLPQESEPDFPSYHGLTSTTRDRRAWSIEVQMHADLDLDIDHIEAIVIGQPDLLADIPDDLLQKTVVAEDAGSLTSMIQQLIIREIDS